MKGLHQESIGACAACGRFSLGRRGRSGPELSGGEKTRVYGADVLNRRTSGTDEPTITALARKRCDTRPQGYEGTMCSCQPTDVLRDLSNRVRSGVKRPDAEQQLTWAVWEYWRNGPRSARRPYRHARSRIANRDDIIRAAFADGRVPLMLPSSADLRAPLTRACGDRSELSPLVPNHWPLAWCPTTSVPPAVCMGLLRPRHFSAGAALEFGERSRG